MGNLKNNKNEYIYAEQKETHRYTKQTCSQQRGEGREKGQISEMGLRNKPMYKIDKQQGYIVQHRELQPLYCNN